MRIPHPLATACVSHSAPRALWHQVIVYAVHVIRGEAEGRKFGHRTMCAFYGWLAPFLFGPFGAEGVENLPPR